MYTKITNAKDHQLTHRYTLWPVYNRSLGLPRDPPLEPHPTTPRTLQLHRALDHIHLGDAHVRHRHPGDGTRSPCPPHPRPPPRITRPPRRLHRVLPLLRRRGERRRAVLVA